MEADRATQVLARLDRVTDPELDEPVTDLGFITGIDVDRDGHVSIDFRLPTYWCAANFAFMMADDMRREVAALPWVTSVTPRLGEHMYAERINHGVARSLSFQDSFGEEAQDDLTALRQVFLVKAFQRRQEALIRHLQAANPSPDALVSLTLGCLARLPLDTTGQRLRERYVERRGIAGRAWPDSLAFVTTDGTPICADDLPAHLRSLRRVASSAEFNGALCIGLLAARFGEDPVGADGEPTLRHFIARGRARWSGTNRGQAHMSDVRETGAATATVFRLIYRSHSRIVDSIEGEEFGRILRVSRANNVGLGVTGALMFYDHWFAQVLEGPEDAVRSLFDRISRDTRHDAVEVSTQGEVAHRVFARWAMAHVGEHGQPDIPLTATRSGVAEAAAWSPGAEQEAVLDKLRGLTRGYGIGA